MTLVRTYFFNMAPKAQLGKEKIDELGFTKI